MSSRFPRDTGDEVAFYLKSLELDNERCVEGLVEQNMASKVKAPTRKNKDKSLRIGKKLPKRTRGVKMKPSFFATVLSSLDGGDKPWALSCVEENVVHLIEYSSFLFLAAVVMDW